MNALVLVNKPVGMRSTQCVAVLRRALGGEKVGHSGTLDSTASGLLVLLVGQAARFSEFVMSLPKVYRVVIQFGAETDTCDYAGEVVSSGDYARADIEAVNDALFMFSGWRLQSPPPVSAVKIEGVPAWKLARSGKNPVMKSRPVFFRRIDVVSPFSVDDGTMTLDVFCGRGTYIRSLARDLGKIAGCGAHVKSLERVSVGTFNVDNADTPDTEHFRLHAVDELCANFTTIHVDAQDSRSFTNGMSILLKRSLRVSRGPFFVRDALCVEGDDFVGFGTYAGWDYIRPTLIVPKR